MMKRCRLSCNEDSTHQETEGALYHLKLVHLAYLLPIEFGLTRHIEMGLSGCIMQAVGAEGFKGM